MSYDEKEKFFQSWLINNPLHRKKGKKLGIVYRDSHSLMYGWVNERKEKKYDYNADKGSNDGVGAKEQKDSSKVSN